MSTGPTGVLEVTVLKGENLTVTNGDTLTICHVEIVADTGDDTYEVSSQSVPCNNPEWAPPIITLGEGTWDILTIQVFVGDQAITKHFPVDIVATGGDYVGMDGHAKICLTYVTSDYDKWR